VRIGAPLLAVCLLLAAACGGSAGTTGRAVPDVRGMNFPDAAVSLYDAHLCVHVVEGRSLPWGTRKEPVEAEAPAPGTRRPAWSLVTLTVRFAEPPNVPRSQRRVHFLDVTWGGGKPPCPPAQTGK
jgi:beta-lactam-binding protein with PASTA domain